jgi:hypothetical protein
MTLLAGIFPLSCATFFPEAAIVTDYKACKLFKGAHRSLVLTALKRVLLAELVPAFQQQCPRR